MKLFYLTILLSLSFAFGQNQIQIQYKQQNIENLSDVTDVQLKQQLELFNDHIDYYNLIIKDFESIYQSRPSINNSQGNSGILIKKTESDNIYYINTSSFQFINFTTYNDKKIIIKDKLEKLEWILGKEEKSIIGLKAKRAYFKQNNTLIEAWYTPELNYKIGPLKFWGLPGLILKIEVKTFDSNNNLSDTMLIEAVEINMNDKTKWKIPTKGEIMTRTEFENFQEKQYQIYLENKNITIDRKID